MLFKRSKKLYQERKAEQYDLLKSMLDARFNDLIVKQEVQTTELEELRFLRRLYEILGLTVSCNCITSDGYLFVPIKK